jgi:16S rRNA (adenine1518-N6/adenine1519-N6)-dimethyltransferase
VSSAIVRLAPHHYPHARVENFTIFQELVTQAFSQRRKTLRNSIRLFLSEDELRSLEIDPGARPETLTIQEFVQLSNLCNENRTTA